MNRSMSLKVTDLDIYWKPACYFLLVSCTVSKLLQVISQITITCQAGASTWLRHLELAKTNPQYFILINLTIHVALWLAVL